MLDYIILGILQGIFEWIPISSEGITALASQFLIKDVNPIDLALFLHLGTLFSVIVYFRKDWKKIILLKNPKLFKFLLISTIVSLIIGYPLYLVIRDVAIGPILLIIMGVGLLATSYFHAKKKRLRMGFNSLALSAGVLQGLAVIPGLSRSGSTIFGLSLGDLSPTNVLRISYLMSVPVVLISSVYLTIQNPVLLEGWPSLIASFLVGLLTLSFLMRASQKIKFSRFTFIFAIICFVGGVIGLIL